MRRPQARHGIRTVGSAAIIAVLALTAARATSVQAGEKPNTYLRTQVYFTGTVRDTDNGKPVAGASVQIAGETIGSVTGTNGGYALSAGERAIGTKFTLTVRRIGYASVSQSVTANRDTVRVDFTIKATNQTLEAISVTRAGAQVADKRRSNVGAMQTLASSPPMGSVAAIAKSSRADYESRNSPRKLGSFDSSVGEPIRGNREQYDRILDNPFLAVSGNPRSTFSVDVDRASYGNVRRFLTQGGNPPADAVRIEEMVNYFPYSLSAPTGDSPIAITTEVAAAPWQTKHRLVRIALQARQIETAKLPPNNLVFLIDVSGSMMSPDKLPLVKSSLRLLVDQMREQDHVAIVAYAGNAGLVLPSTSGSDKARIAEAIDRLEAGGSTAGGAGIQLAYRVAKDNFNREGNNRVILATDGDFNVGESSDAAMERLVESKRSEGTYLTVLGFGTGNYQDAKMKKLAKIGNGNYAYVDDISEARKTLVHEMGATLLTVANDVKLQVEFNPAAVKAFRLIGYEDRLLRDEDFIDDKKDAGDVGAGHSVTAMYEIVPVGVSGTTEVRGSDAFRYSTPSNETFGKANEMMYVKLRYKHPGDSTSKLMTHVIDTRDIKKTTSSDFRFAASVASFGMLLRNSEYKGDASATSVLTMAREAQGRDDGGYRAEFVQLVERWQSINKGVATKTRD
ncbi:MAG: von Willebrand factor type A domain-containing protein [Gemmatimonadaceae bacterium]